MVGIYKQLIQRRTPRGVRGLKFSILPDMYQVPSRTPRGVRGLKLPCVLLMSWKWKVAPLAGCVD